MWADYFINGTGTWVTPGCLGASVLPEQAGEGKGGDVFCLSYFCAFNKKTAFFWRYIPVNESGFAC